MLKMWSIEKLKPNHRNYSKTQIYRMLLYKFELKYRFYVDLFDINEFSRDIFLFRYVLQLLL